MKMLTITGASDSIDSVISTCLVNEQFHPVEAARVTNSKHLIPFDWSNAWQAPLASAESLLGALQIPLEFMDFHASLLTKETAEAYLQEATAKNSLVLLTALQ